VDLLRRMKRKDDATGALFPGTTGKPRVTLRRPWVQICKAAGLSEVFTLQGKRRTITRSRPKIRIHDLRHSFASHLVSNGVSLHIVGKLLGHTQAQTTQRYAHVADQALRDASNRMGEIYKTASKGKKP
jgi:site-specific recombinase XerD